MRRGADAMTGCEGHAGLAEEARAAVVALLDRVTPLLDRLGEAEGQRPAQSAETCTWCPVCAGLAALRGERPDLAVRLGEHLAGLLAVLRAALEEQPAPPAAEASPPRAVQHIPVRRVGEPGPR